MLHLTMKEGDYLMIGKDIKLSFDRVVSGDRMYIRVSAPRSMEILRDKVFERELTGIVEGEEKTPEEIKQAEELLAQLKAERDKDKAERDKQASFRRHERKLRVAKNKELKLKSKAC